jgi:pimeloyl-ACP methyl ester carboxylesterase
MIETKQVELPQGTVRYRDSGSGEPIVFIHGALVDGRLWKDVVPLLEPDFRCVVPDLPLGSHRTPLNPDADLTPYGLARLVADFIEALDLRDVTLVGNDTGGAICQIVATRHPERLARLVLTPSDAYEDFPPLAFKYLTAAARVPGGLTLLAQSTRLKALRGSPLAYGWLTKKRLDDELLRSWVEPGLANRAISRDVAKVLRGAHKRYTLEAAEKLRSFDKPTLIAWSTEDRFFKLKHGERLAREIPNARLERIDDARTFVSLDQPERLAGLIAGFIREPRREPAGTA